MALLLRIAVLLACSYVLIGVALFFLQGFLMFPRGSSVWCTPEDAGWSFEEVRLPVSGHETHGWFIPAAGDAQGVVLFSHGNGGTIADRIESIAIFRDALGYDVLIYDYGGYGLSTGKPSEQRCYADIQACWEWLTKTRGIAPGGIVLFGRSLGGAVAADWAAKLEEEDQPQALIIESSFTSAPEVGQSAYPIFPVRRLLRHKFDTASKLDAIECPILVVHSPEDDIVPYRFGRALYEKAPEPKRFLKIRGSHNQGFLDSGTDYIDGLGAFLRETRKTRETASRKEAIASDDLMQEAL